PVLSIINPINDLNRSGKVVCRCMDQVAVTLYAYMIISRVAIGRRVLVSIQCNANGWTNTSKAKTTSRDTNAGTDWLHNECNSICTITICTSKIYIKQEGK